MCVNFFVIDLFLFLGVLYFLSFFSSSRYKICVCVSWYYHPRKCWAPQWKSPEGYETQSTSNNWGLCNSKSQETRKKILCYMEENNKKKRHLQVTNTISSGYSLSVLENIYIF